MRIRVDVTDPDNVFVHKGGARKGRTYVDFHVKKTGHMTLSQMVSSIKNGFVIPHA